ncbi:MAG: hypothetical protein M0R47_01150 [Methylobacter sp.]|uniref:hypothetical protein n=1 Tax=Methylobacter sp. TaxID=2051955 RepID=UPI0025CD7788|nr:hypothetical protein [Methylobacter sp.]MCK9619121.1 hypothetical protein [Methylobacter sp.]
MNSVESTYYLSELVKKLSQDRNAGSYSGEFTVSAVANGKEKISREPIGCQLTINHDSVDVSVFWEDYGYKGFRDMGLYGRTNSKFFSVNELSSNSFEIINNSDKNKLVFEW